MKQVGKKALALVCVFAMLAGTIWMGDYEEVQADTTYPTKQIIAEDWTFTSSIHTKTGFNIAMDGNAAMSEYKLHIKMYIPQEAYDRVKGQTLHFEVNQSGTIDNQEYNFNPTDFKVGENEWTYTFDKAGKQNSPVWGNALKGCRIFFGSASSSMSGIILREMKVVRVEPKEWTAFNNKTMDAVGQTASLALSSPITFGTEIQESDVMACVKLNISDTFWEANKDRQGGNVMHIEFRPTNEVDKSEYEINIPVTKAGETTYNVLLSDETVWKSGGPDISQGFSYYRIYMNGGGTSMKGMTIVDLSFVDVTPYIEEHTSNVWQVVSNITISDKSFGMFGLQITPTVETKYLAMHISLDVPQERLEEIQNAQLRVKIGTKNDPDACGYAPIITKSGVNEFVCSLETNTRLKDFATIENCRVYDNNGETVSMNGVKITVKLVDVRNYVTAGSTPAELNIDESLVPEGYLFAGWYTDEACTSVNALEGEASGKVYAKYVREDLLDVKAQSTNYMDSYIKEYGVCKDVTISSGSSYEVQGINLDLTSYSNDYTTSDNKKQYNNLSLYVELEVPESVVNHSNYDYTQWRVKFSNESGKYNEYELGFNLKDMNINSAGKYSYTLPIVVSNDFSFAKPIQQWRIYNSVSIQGVKVNSIKFVYTDPEAPKDNEAGGAIRFITSVDSLQYQQVGFDITINGRTLTKHSNVVYEELYAVGSSDGNTITYKPSDIDPVGKYFSTYTIDKIPQDQFDTEITVQSYWITQDGTKVLGELKTYTVNGTTAE